MSRGDWIALGLTLGAYFAGMVMGVVFAQNVLEWRKP